jgi:hypothetical protein
MNRRGVLLGLFAAPLAPKLPAVESPAHPFAQRLAGGTIKVGDMVSIPMGSLTIGGKQVGQLYRVTWSSTGAK